ncbi:MAG: hypothetical protein ACI9CD_000977 [Candidatus Deianiraeaceae bacterium]|jgi:hypothetical protein
MKISDLKNYELPTEQLSYKVNIFKNRNKLPILSTMLYNMIDLTIINSTRVIIFIVIFKLFMRSTSSTAITTMIDAYQNQNSKEILLIIIQNKIHMYALYSAIISFLTGSLYCILFMKYSSFGTLGMKFAKFTIQTRTGGNPTIVSTTMWYFIKIIYPLALIMSFLTFLITRNINSVLIFFITIAIIFSNAISNVFGMQPLYEKFSGIKLIKK